MDGGGWHTLIESRCQAPFSASRSAARCPLTPADAMPTALIDAMGTLCRAQSSPSHDFNLWNMLGCRVTLGGAAVGAGGEACTVP